MGGIFGGPRPPANKVTAASATQIVNNTLINIAPDTKNKNRSSNIIRALRGGINRYNTQTINALTRVEALSENTLSYTTTNTIDNEIVQSLERKMTALISGIGNAISNDDIDLNSQITNSVSNLNITNILPICTNDVVFVNEIVAEDNGQNSYNTQQIEGQFFIKCITNNTLSVSALSDITNSINQKARVEEKNPLDFIADIFKSIADFVIVIFIFFILIGIIFAYKSFFGKNNQQQRS